MSNKNKSIGATKFSWWQILLAIVCIAGGVYYKGGDHQEQISEQTATPPPPQQENRVVEQPQVQPKPQMQPKPSQQIEQTQAKPNKPEPAPKYNVKKWHAENLQRHWEKHQAEFPEFHSAQEYGEASLQFFRNPPEKTLVKNRADGDRLYFHPPSGNFGVVTSDGFPKTFFRPDSGMRYWEKQ